MKTNNWKNWHLCGLADAEDDAEDVVCVLLQGEHQVAQTPGKTQKHSQREADQDLLPQGGLLGAARQNRFASCIFKPQRNKKNLDFRSF